MGEREELLALVEMHDSLADIELSEKSADMHRRTAKYLRAYMHGRAQGAWRPIETAPKDKCILLCVEGYEPALGRWWPVTGCWSSFDWEGHFESDQDASDFYAGSRYEPTHWMPVPTPPSLPSTERGTAND